MGLARTFGLIASLSLLLSCVIDDVIGPDASGPVGAPGTWSKVATGGSHTCGIAASGASYCWGANSVTGAFGAAVSGQLGDGSVVDHDAPSKVAGGLSFKLVTAGDQHSCGLTNDDKAYCWGLEGMLGDSTTTSRTVPVPVAGGFRFSSIAAGSTRTCALTTEGAAYCWGRDAAEPGPATYPQPVKGGHVFKSIAAGTMTCALDADGAAYCWTGILRNRTDASALEDPGLIGGGHAFASIGAGYYYACGVTTAGSLYCWADIQTYRSFFSTFPPTPMPVLPEIQFVSVSVYQARGCALSADGDAYCWDNDRIQPQRVVAPFKFREVHAGGTQFCGVSVWGNAYCWGSNLRGQFGVPLYGTTGQSSVPVRVPAPAGEPLAIREPPYLEVKPDTLRPTVIGQTFQLTATVVDVSGRTLRNPPVAWNSLRSWVAAVDANGVVRMVSLGGGSITPIYASYGSVADTIFVLSYPPLEGASKSNTRVDRTPTLATAPRP